MSASSPLFMIGNKALNACALKYAPNMMKMFPNAASLVKNPNMIASPPTSSIKPTNPSKLKIACWFPPKSPKTFCMP